METSSVRGENWHPTVAGVTACGPVLHRKAGNAPCLKCIQRQRVPVRDIPCRGILYII